MIKELISEQTSLFPSIVDKFVKLGLSTQPLNQPQAIEAINLAYQYGGLDKPKEVIFVKSPMVGQVLVKKITQSLIYPINYGNDFSNLAYHYTCQQLGLTEEIKPLAGLFALAEECGPVWTFENLCIISERPTSLIFNEQGKLHNFKGPAIIYSDGYGQYYVNGKFIQSAIGERLAWYLNNRKSSNQPKFSLKKELDKYQDLNLEIGNQVENQIRTQVFNQVRTQVFNQVRTQVFNQVWNQVYNQVKNQVCNQVWNQVYNQVYNQVWFQVWAQVLKQN